MQHDLGRRGGCLFPLGLIVTLLALAGCYEPASTYNPERGRYVDAQEYYRDRVLRCVWSVGDGEREGASFDSLRRSGYIAKDGSITRAWQRFLHLSACNFAMSDDARHQHRNAGGAYQ